MKEYEYLPYLVTGPNKKVETDRSKAVSWILRNHKGIKLIFPDDLGVANYIPGFDFLRTYLLKRSDQFEYVLSRIIVHHINLHISGAAIFELGQFHSLLTPSRTSVHFPVFKNSLSDLNKRYNASQYIKIIYGSSIKGYWANAVADYPDAFWTGNNSLFKELSKVVYRSKRRSLNLQPRLFSNSNKINYQSITIDNSEMKIPLKHLYFIFSTYILSNKGRIVSIKSISDITKLRDDFHKYVKSIIPRELVPKFLYSKTRSTWTSILCSFLWIAMIQYKKILTAGMYGKGIYSKVSRMQAKLLVLKSIGAKYYKFILGRRIVTTYGKSLAGDKRRLEMVKLNQRLKSKFDISDSAIAYDSNKLYLDAATIHKVDSEFEFVKIDLKNFFNSIALLDSKNLPIELIKLEINKEEFEQGTINAPVISNIIMRKFDDWIVSTFPKSNYTRYSDDILITWKTGQHSTSEIAELTKKKLKTMGLESNDKKFLSGDQKDQFKYIGLIYKEGEWWIPNNFSKKIVKWSYNPEKYGLTTKYLRKLVKSLNDRNIKFRSDTIINSI